MDTTERIPASARLAGFLSLLAAIAFGTSTAWAQNSAPDGIPAPDWSGLVAARQVARHAIGTSEHGHEAFNPGQRWSTRFDGRGFEVEPEVAAWRWGLELASFGTGREQRSITRTADVSVAGPRLTYGWTPALEEWYVNDGRGLEHGYTVRQRFGDVRDGDRLVFVLRVRGGLTPEVSADGRDVHFLNEGGRATVHYCGLTVFDADGRTLEAGFELDGDCLRLTVDDSDASYPVTIDPVAQQAYLKASNSDDGDHFGYAVAIDGNYAVVGAPLEDSDATGVNGDQSNRRAVDSGAAYVFRRNSSGTWVQEAYLKPTDTDAGDDFGWSVAISGLTVVVGAPQEDSVARTVDGNDRDNSRSDSGAAYVYVREPRFATWTVQGYLKASNADADDGFGGSVAIDGDTIVVGANLEDSHATGVNGAQGVNGAPQSGAAYVYVRSGPQWSQQAYLKASNTASSNIFGTSVAIDGDTVVVGAPWEASDAFDSGATYVFVRTGASTWTQQAYLKGIASRSSQIFGTDVSVSGDTIVVGAPGVDYDTFWYTTNDIGAAFVFVRDGTTWSRQQMLAVPHGDVDDVFGTRVSISGEHIVVGADGEDGGSVGIDGDESDNSDPGSGAAYLFRRCGATWPLVAYLKSSNSAAGDGFGGDVAISGDTAIVGAPWEDSDQDGVNPSQFDNSAPDAGAAYVLTFDIGVELVRGIGGGCPGESAPFALSAPSNSTAFSIASPTLTQPCTGGTVLLFGRCATTPIPVPSWLGCGTCDLMIDIVWGAGPSTLVVPPGLQPGFQFCVQTGCVAGSCVDLSQAARVTVCD